MASVIIAALVSLAWALSAVRLGPRIGYVDRPDDPALKAHEQPAVPLGGVGVFLAVHLAALARGGLDATLLVASTLLLVLGLVDDRRPLKPVTRLGVEVLAAAVLVFGDATGGDPLRLGAGVLLVVLAVNAVNLFDGLDGLAASAGLVAALGVAWFASGHGIQVPGALELAAALGGFLFLNWHPARVFLGDAGAYVVGLVVADLILDSTPGGVVELTLGAGLLGVFAVDLFVTLVRRMLNRRPLFSGDRSHVYDQLRDRGWSVPRIAVAAAAAQAGLVAAVVASDRFLGSWRAMAALLLLLVGLVGWLAAAGFLRVDAPQTSED